MVTCQLDQYFDDASDFKPERWDRSSPSSSPDQISKSSPDHPTASCPHESQSVTNKFSLLPFGFGNRMCAGRRFSELELLMATAKVVLNFRLEAVTKEIDRTHAFLVIPSHPIQIKLHDR